MATELPGHRRLLVLVDGLDGKPLADLDDEELDVLAERIVEQMNAAVADQDAGE